MSWDDFFRVLAQFLITALAIIVVAVGILEVKREYSKKENRPE